MNRISMFEVMLLAVTVVVSTAVLFMPFLTARAAGQDAWISVLVAGAATLLPAWAVGVIMSRFPRQSLIEALPRLLGPLGYPLGLAYILFFLLAAIIIVWQLQEFIVGTLMVDTPELVIRAVFLLAVGYGAFNGATSLIRTNVYVAPLGLVVIGLVLILPLTRMDASFLVPVFERGYRPMLDGAALLLGWLCQIPLVLMMFHRYVENKFLHLAPRKAVLTVAIITVALELGALGTLAAFGSRQTASLYYPSFAVARIISIGVFLEHIEVTFVAVWIGAMYIAASFYIQSIADGLASLLKFGPGRPKLVVYCLLLAALIGWQLFIDVSLYDLLWLTGKVAPWVSIVLGGFVPVALMLRALALPLAPGGEGKNHDAK